MSNRVFADYRHEQTPVRSQGQRPTCASFAATAAHEWAAQRRYLFSPEFAVWAGKKHDGDTTDDSTTVDAVLSGLESEGHAVESAWPYGNPRWPAQPRAAACLASNRHALPKWKAFSAHGLADVTRALKTCAIVATMWHVPTAWDNAWSSGVVDLSSNPTIVGAHAMLVVGISDTPTMGLLIKNSWGPKWGLNGYGLVTERYANALLFAAHGVERQ